MYLLYTNSIILHTPQNVTTFSPLSSSPPLPYSLSLPLPVYTTDHTAGECVSLSQPLLLFLLLLLLFLLLSVSLLLLGILIFSSIIRLFITITLCSLLWKLWEAMLMIWWFTDDTFDVLKITYNIERR